MWVESVCQFVGAQRSLSVAKDCLAAHVTCAVDRHKDRVDVYIEKKWIHKGNNEIA